MGNYRLTPDAEDDLWRIYNYGLERWGEAQADRYYYNFIEQFEKIAQQPLLYQAADHIRAGYRRCICGADTIYDRINGDIVEIMNIIGRQDTDEMI